MTLPAVIDKAARVYDMSGDDFVYTLRNTGVVPQGTKDAEMVSCIMVAYEHQLNPLTREIYFMRAKNGTIQPIVSVDGWIKKCNSHPQFDGMEFKDHFENGQLEAISCMIWRKDRSRPVSITEYMSECKRKSEKPTPWDSHPSRMLRHKALIQCARIAFGFAGVMERDEFDKWQEEIKDVTPEPDFPDIDAEMPDEVDQSPVEDAEVIEPVVEHVDPGKALVEFEGDLLLCSELSDLEETWLQWEDTIGEFPRKVRDTFVKMYEDACAQMKGEAA